MKRLFYLFVIFCAAVQVSWSSDTGSLARSISATLLVSAPEKAAEEALAWTEARDGYFLVRSTDLVVLLFPSEKLGEFRTFLEELSEDIIDLSIESHDMSEEIRSLESGISARTEVLKKNLSYIDGADVKGTLAIENEVMRLLREIESMKGRLNRVKTDVRMARARVSFTFHDESLPSDIPSSFEWVNHVDFYRFVQED